MNPAVFQHPYLVYTSRPEENYAEREHPFSTSSTIPSADFASAIRRSQDEIDKDTIAGSVVQPMNTGNLDFNSNNTMLQDNSYPPNPQLLLSPPSSIDGSTHSVINTTSPPFSYASGHRLSSGNAVPNDQYTPGPTTFAHGGWNDIVPPIGSRLRTTMHSNLSPPVNYGHPSGISGQFFPSANRNLGTYHNSYSSGRGFPAPLLQDIPFQTRPRTSSFGLPVPSAFVPGYVYNQMPPPIANHPEGPPFEETKILFPLVTARRETLSPDITAGIQKGFFQVDGNWTCYRRNYFTVTCAFSFKHKHPEGTVFLQRDISVDAVQSYAVSISARTANANSQESETRQLVQHTPKRDKATESIPGRHLVQPNTGQSIQTTHFGGASPYHNNPNISQSILSNYDTYSPHTAQVIPTSYTFERIQFQKATANNGKRRAQQQFFHVVVELSVNIGRPAGEDKWIIVATKQSYPMVVRGRSPGHYKDNVRRDGQTHMGPDRTSGSGGDPSVQFTMPSLLGHSDATMDWTPSRRNPFHQYGQTYPLDPYDSTDPSETSSPSLVNAVHDHGGLMRPMCSPRCSLNSLPHPSPEKDSPAVTQRLCQSMSKRPLTSNQDARFDHHSSSLQTDVPVTSHSLQTMSNLTYLCA